MTPPAKRRPATPASQGPTRTAPDVPIVAAPPPVAPAKTKASTQKAPTRDASRDSAPPTETGHVDAESRATTESPRRQTTQLPRRQTTQSPRRPLSLYPLPVWPD